MPVLLSLYLPTWASDLVRRRRRLEWTHAVVLSRVDHQREVVAARCPRAARAGVLVGMTVAHARALIPADRAHVAPLDGADAARTLGRLAAWMLRFVPVVAIDEPDGLLLDATGCERLYGGTGRLTERVLAALQRLGFAARLAAAPTWGAAWALARFGDDGMTVLPPGELRPALSPLPVAALRIDTRTQEELRQVGIERIGQVLGLPRPALADRYGQTLLLRLDQALGRAMEAVTPIRPRGPVAAERMFDGPTGRLQDIRLVIRRLIGNVAALLEAGENGCRRLEVTLFRSDLPPLALAVQTARPTRDAGHLWTLLGPKTESAQLGFGVEGVRVLALAVTRLPHEQYSAWEPESTNHAPEVGRLVDTLAARLGPDRVVRVAPVESHLPERALAYRPIERIDREARPGPALADTDRPSLLLPAPIPAEAVLLVPDGPIALVRLRGEGLRVVTSIGPERVEPEWWRAPGPARDYFKVQTESGRWLWVFREIPGGRWFAHGEWA